MKRDILLWFVVIVIIVNYYQHHCRWVSCRNVPEEKEILSANGKDNFSFFIQLTIIFGLQPSHNRLDRYLTPMLQFNVLREYNSMNELASG